MFSTLRRKVIAALVLGLLSGPRPTVWADELPATIERIKGSIVAIGILERTRRPPARYLATGFVIGDGLHVVTNAHVIPEKLAAETEFLAVFLPQGTVRDARQADIVAVDQEHDVCVLKVNGTPLPPLSLGDSDRVREGQSYAFTGFPFGLVLGLFPATHKGIISAVAPITTPRKPTSLLDPGELKRLSSTYNVFQLDATAYPGNSGSPLYDSETGQVIGILNKGIVQQSKDSSVQIPTGVSFAIPINYLRELLKKAGIEK